MTKSTLILFTSDSEDLVKELLTSFNKASIDAICLDNVLQASQPSYFQKLSKSKLQIIFFSPDFLKFLECKPLDAFYICNELNPKYVLAVFCGISISDIRCYHTASLKDFSSWNKYEIEPQDERSGKKFLLPVELVNQIKHIIKGGCKELEKIIVTPHYLYKGNNTGYVIFPNSFENAEDITIQLEKPSQHEVLTQQLNPYVLKFTISDEIFQNSHNVNVLIFKKEVVICQQSIHLSRGPPVFLNPCFHAIESNEYTRVTNPRATKEEIYLDEQLQFLSDFSKTNTSDDMQDSPVETLSILDRRITKTKGINRTSDVYDAEKSLIKLCEQYGLKELSMLISNEVFSWTTTEEKVSKDKAKNEKETSDIERNNRGSKCGLPEMDAEYRMNSFFIEESDICSLRYTRRSLSLPTTLMPASNTRESYGQYMDMSGKEVTGINSKPHEKFIKNMRQFCLDQAPPCSNEELGESPTSPLSSNYYVSMNLPREEINYRLSLLKCGLSLSQQELLELLHQFKMGDATISNVEEQFALWRERHNTEIEKQEKSRKASVFSFPWKTPNSKPKKKDSLEQKAKNESTVVDSHNRNPSRKISSTSGSSNSSKTSAANSSFVDHSNERPCDQNTISEYTLAASGWVTSYSPAYCKNHCLLHPEKFPPPLPNRPPPPLKEDMPPIKPVPFPRKFFPTKNSETSSISEIIYENISSPGVNVSDEVKQVQKYYQNSEHETTSFVDLCEKYGLDELGECYISGALFLQPTSFEDSKSNFEYSNPGYESEEKDSDGYERPIKAHPLQHKVSPKKLSLRKSNSLPTTFDQMDEYIDFATAPNFSGRKEINEEEKKQSLKVQLSNSQQELLELMYAFKRGDKTISQVEEQFKEWHSRNIGAQKSKQEKRKQSTFALPGLRNLILGKPKKKSSVDRIFEIKSPGNPQFQKKPLPPVPTLRDLSTYNNSLSGQGVVYKNKKRLSEKPIPPPKPKLLISKMRSVDHNKFRSGSCPDSFAPDPPSSPDYVLPDNVFVKNCQIKLKDVKTTGLVNFTKKEPKEGTPEGLPSSSGTPQTLPKDMEIIEKVPTIEESFTPETLKLLQEANLVRNSMKKEQSMFYIRRCSSYPSLTLSIGKNQPIYLEILYSGNDKNDLKS